MHECEKYQEMISSLLDGELTETESSTLHAHIAQCESCRRMYTAFSALSREIGGELVEPPAELAAGIMFKIKNAPPQKARSRRFHPGRIAALAACLALVIFAASRLEFPHTGGATPAAAPFGIMDNEIATEDESAESFDSMDKIDPDARAADAPAPTVAPAILPVPEPYAPNDGSAEAGTSQTNYNIPPSLETKTALYTAPELVSALPEDAEALGQLSELLMGESIEWITLEIPGDTQVFASPSGAELFIPLSDGSILCYAAES